jgi:hypothetical protein
LAEAQQVFDFPNTDEGVRVLNAVAAKARAWMQRVRLIDTGTPVVEYLRIEQDTPTLYLHAAVDVADFSANDVTVDHYSRGVLLTSYSANAGDLVVQSDEFSARVDLIAGSFPASTGASFLEVTYAGGWSAVPGDVVQGAIEQARVDLKRFRGEVGMISRGKGSESVEFDTHGVVRTVADLWQPYRVLV